MECDVSVVIPTFNHGRYLARALRSALTQVTPPAEVIVIDDGSTDETPQVVQQFPSVRYICQANRGPSAARNRGIAEATGRWIAFLDADDWWLPDKISLQLHAAATHPEAALIYTSSLLVTSEGEQLLSCAVEPGCIWPTLRYRNCISGGSGAMVRRDVLLAEGGFDEMLISTEDWDMWVRLARKYQFAAVQSAVTMVCDAPCSLSTQYERTIKNTEAMLDKTLVSDLHGLGRVMWSRRIRSAYLFHASISARTVDRKTSSHFLRKSLVQWPSPFFIPKRWVAMCLSVVRGWT